MKNYEGIFILKPDLDKAGIDKVLGQIQELISRHKGAISETKDMGKSKLTYPVKKNKEGVYYKINFSIAPEAVADIRKNLTLNEVVLRMMIVEA